MNAETYEKLVKRQSNELKIYSLILLIFLGLVGYYFYGQYDLFVERKESLAFGQSQVETITEKIDDEKISYDKSKPIFDAQNKGLEEKIKTVFPSNSDELEFTRKFDLLEEDLHKKDSPFKVLSLNYGSVIPQEGYAVLPFIVNISTSYDKMLKFLKLIESSGSLSVGEQLRLMDIESINLSLPQDSDDSTDSGEMSFSIRLNAYFQKTNE